LGLLTETRGDTVKAARLAGALWLIVIAVSVLSLLVQSTSPRLAFAALQLGAVAYLGVTALLYQLFKHVNRDIALFGLCCGIVGVASGDASSAGTSVGPSQSFYVEMVFFGFQMMAVGYLITRSVLLPRLLGLLLTLGGLSYVVVSFANFLSVSVGAQLAPFVIPIAILGEGAVTLWLLVKGVRASV
jgi:Domain of unknown function (DUF4386)